MLSNKGRHDTTKLGSNVLQELKINQRRILIDSLEIGIPAPEQMIALGERQLPNGVKVGQLLNSKTLNYKKFTPHRDGLFCERIFGPVQSFVCACGKKKESVQSKIKQKDIAKANLLPPARGVSMLEIAQNKSSFSTKNNPYAPSQMEVSFCPKCQVEYISKNVRRHRLGYIKLFAPVTHIWYLKGRPSYLSLFLGKRKKAITSLAYCNAYLVEQVCSDVETPNLLKNRDKSASALVRRGNVRVWQDLHLDDSRTKNEKTPFVKDLFLHKDSLSPISKEEFHLKLPLSSKSSDNCANDGDTRNRLDKAQTYFQDQTSLRTSYSKSFFSLLTQLLPETVTQASQTNSNDVVERSWEVQFKQARAVHKQSQERLGYKVSTKLEAVKYFLETALAVANQRFENRNSHFFSVKRDKLKILHTPYVRAQALPFLPSLICSFHLRDCLISFLQSLPCPEDIPIPTYCQTPRRYPLRDVHKFLAELRSTNTQNQVERLTSDSITRFIGFDKTKVTQRSSLTKRSVYFKNQRHSQNVGVSKASNTTRINRASEHPSNLASLVSTSFLHPFKEHPLDSCAGSPTSFLKKRERDIVVHRVRDLNLFSQTKASSFMSVDSEYKNRTYNAFIRENQAEKTRQSLKKKYTTWNKGTRTKKRIFTLNGLGLGNVIKNTLYNQTLTSFSPGFIDSNGQRAVTKTKSRFGLLPLNLNIVSSSTLTHKNILTSLPLNKKHISGGVVFNAKHSTNQLLCFNRNSTGISTPTQLLARETGISLRGVLLNIFFDIIKARFVGFSLPFSVEWFQTNDVKRVELDHQQKQTVISPNSETIVISEQANIKTQLLDSKTRKLALPKVKAKMRQDLVTQEQVYSLTNSNNLNPVSFTNGKHLVRKQSPLSFGFYSNRTDNRLDNSKNNKTDSLQLDYNQTLPQFHTKLFTKLPNRTVQFETREKLFRRLLKQKRNSQYKFKRFLYMYIPTLLYARDFNWDKNKVSSTKLWFKVSPLRYKYRHGLTLNVPSNTSAETGNRCADQGVVNQLQTKGNAKLMLMQNEGVVKTSFLQMLCVAKRSFALQSKANRLQNFQLMRCKSKICISYANAKRSLATQRIRFATRANQRFASSDLQTFFFRKKIDTYQARLLHVVFRAVPEGILLNQLTPIKSSFLHKNEVFIYKQNKVLFGVQKLGYTYLLTKDLQEQKPEKPLNKKVNTKTKSWYTCLTSKALSAKRSFAQVRTNAELKPANAKRSFACATVQSNLYVPKLVFDKPGVVQAKQSITSLYKVHLNPLQVSKSELTLTKQGTCENEVISKQSFGTQKDQLLNIKPRTRIDTKQDIDTSTSFGSETISKWHITGAKEILLYTGGGALESLLKRFNTSLFCQFLLGELQLLRKHYKDQIIVEYNKNQIVAEHSSDSLRENKSDNKDLRSVFSKHSFGKALPLSNLNIATEHALQHKERHLGVRYVVTDKSANLFCRRIYRTTRRLKIVQLLMRSRRRPEWMMISVLPVLPPDLRPVLQMGDNLIVASDLNTLYQRVIYRNNRHYKGRFLDFHFVSSIHRLVQDAVDRLIENGKGGSTPFLTPGGRPLKSLSDILKGKRGRFRFNLLGKRVDFSGRSVIVVDPNLKIHECGLPKEMALELYKYLLIRQLLLQKRVSSIVNAKKVIKQRKPFIWDILRQIIYYHPLLLNRAPTLHRLGIQAFQPKLTLGNAILLHPLVCAGFNADFDGDQMGVHLPLSPQARAEAWDLLWSRNNLLSPATGQPILLPSQDMVLGFYYMTSLLPYGTTNKSNAIRTKHTFASTRSQKEEETKINLNSALDTSYTLHFSERSSIAERSLVRSSHNSVPANQASKNKVDGIVVHVFSDPFKVLCAYQNKQIDIHTPIWLKWAGKSENGEKSQTPLEVRINRFGDQTQIYPTHKFENQTYKDGNASFFSFHIRTTVGRVLVNNLIRQNY